MRRAMAAGKSENRAQIIFWTEASFVIVTTVSPLASVPEMKPAIPSSRATRAPEMAEPNFCDMVPEENIRPVDEVPFFCVA